MVRRAATCVTWAAALLVLTAAVSPAADAPMELLDALATGQVDAGFYGNGDQSVTGRLRRGAFGPEQLYVEPGTQFWAQFEETGQQQRQGMTTIGRVPIDLSRRAIAYIESPTACTNYDLPAPTRYDRMTPVRCPDPRMAALTDQIGRVGAPRPAAQLAVWAIANDPAWDDVVGQAERYADADSDEARAEIVEGYRQQAAHLLWQVGLDPTGLRMFRDQ